MKNKAAKLFNASKGTEFKIVIEEDKKAKCPEERFDVHLYLEGVLEKSIIGVPHYHIQSPFGDDAQ